MVVAELAIASVGIYPCLSVITNLASDVVQGVRIKVTVVILLNNLHNIVAIALVANNNRERTILVIVICRALDILNGDLKIFICPITCLTSCNKFKQLCWVGGRRKLAADNMWCLGGLDFITKVVAVFTPIVDSDPCSCKVRVSVTQNVINVSIKSLTKEVLLAIVCVRNTSCQQLWVCVEDLSDILRIVLIKVECNCVNNAGATFDLSLEFFCSAWIRNNNNVGTGELSCRAGQMSCSSVVS